MPEYLRRSANDANRDNLTQSDRWDGSDRGLIWCWERGREKQVESPDLAVRAVEGELVPLVWKRGSLHYLAMWQGLRGDDLHILVKGETKIVCTKTLKPFVFAYGAGIDGEDVEEYEE